MNDPTLRRDLAVAALFFGASGLLLHRLAPPLALVLGLAAVVLAVLSARSWLARSKSDAGE